MRKLILMLAMLAIVSPAMAVNVQITVTDNKDLTATIGYSADANVSGFGLDITATDANITAVDPNHRGESVSGSKGYGIFPASFDREIDPNSPNYNDPCYTPAAKGTDTGALGGIGTSGVTVELGALYMDGNQPSRIGGLCVITLDKSCTIDVVVNSARGGIVLEDTTTAVLTDGSGTASGGYPSCWDYTTFCHGDGASAGGSGPPDTIVNNDDFIHYRDGYYESYPNQKYKDHACGDYTRDGIINNDDFIPYRDNYYKTVTPGNGFPACTTGDINNVY